MLPKAEFYIEREKVSVSCSVDGGRAQGHSERMPVSHLEQMCVCHTSSDHVRKLESFS